MADRLVFGVTGASGMPLALAVLQAFRSVPDLEVHCIVSANARQVLRVELGAEDSLFTPLVSALYDPEDMTIGPASGSWRHRGVIVCPCSMRSLACIAHGTGTNSLHRACDVALKERFPLILVPRETPFSLLHLRNMQTVTEFGAVLMPFMPQFFLGENTLPAMMRHFAGRLLDQLGIPNTLSRRWRDEVSR